MAAEKKKKFDWGYCECGCHGSYLSLGGLFFWSFTRWEVDPLTNVTARDKKGDPVIRDVILRDSHGFYSGTELGKFESREKRDAFIRKELRAVKREIEKVL